MLEPIRVASPYLHQLLRPGLTMAPTEATILSTFLLPPAPLPSIISLKAFTELFPRSQQSSPQIRTLYRDLQHQRAQIADAVAHNIATETKRGNAQRRAVVKARRAAAREEQDDEVDIESAVSTATLRKQGIFADSCPLSFLGLHQTYQCRNRTP